MSRFGIAVQRLKGALLSARNAVSDRVWNWRHWRCVPVLRMRVADRREYLVMHPETVDRLCESCRAAVQRQQILDARWRDRRDDR